MTGTATRLQGRAWLGLAAVAVVWAAAATAARTMPGDAVAIAAVFDVTVTAGVVLYLVAVRGGHLPRWTLAVLAAAGLAFAKLTFATGARVAHVALVASVALELVALGLVVVRARRGRRAWREARVAGGARIDALEAAVAAGGLPRRLAALLATELAVLHAAVTGWRRPTVEPRRFTVHRASGVVMYAGVFAVLAVIEAAGLHLVLISVGWTTAAWISTATSLYAVVWLVGAAHALRHGGVTVGADAIDLAIGLRWRGRVPRADVAAVELGAPPAGEHDVVHVSRLAPTVVLRLRAPCTLRGVFGRRHSVQAIAIAVDEPEAFVAALVRTGE